MVAAGASRSARRQPPGSDRHACVSREGRQPAVCGELESGPRLLLVGGESVASHSRWEGAHRAKVQKRLRPQASGRVFGRRGTASAQRGWEKIKGASPSEGKEWCRGTELNRRHRDFQSRALPTELPRPGTPALDGTLIIAVRVTRPQAGATRGPPFNQHSTIDNQQFPITFHLYF